MKPILQVQLAIDPDEVERIRVNVYHAIKLAKKLFDAKDLLEKHRDAIHAVNALGMLDGVSSEYEHLSRQLDHIWAMMTQGCISLSYITSLERTYAALGDLARPPSCQQIVFPSPPKPQPEPIPQQQKEEGREATDSEIPF